MNLNPVERKLPLNEDYIKFKEWTISYKKSHILKSVCVNEGELGFFFFIYNKILKQYYF